ncbi:AAA family ATPase [Microvirga rosea]|uniref:AAA family ATPase n=1 Tax=Microvirga rosea TaxID=2715425 RepID=UPI001D0AB7C2|nr:AAA family ATPase [Microvirga rosea]MCB8821923.1 AAA family ATPase [Microvirga rosea]
MPTVSDTLKNEHSDTIDFLAAEFDSETQTTDARSKAKDEYLTVPSDLIANLVLSSALGRNGRRLLKKGGPQVVILRVPTAAWVEPVSRAANRLSGYKAMILLAKTDQRRYEETVQAKVAHAFDRRVPVIAVSQNPDTYLPQMVCGAADLFVSVTAPAPRVMSKAIAVWCGSSRVVGLKAEDLSGLDLPDLVSCLRPGSTPDICIERLRRAACSRAVIRIHDDTPRLEDLHGYGRARDWALSLIDDVARVRRSELSPDALESGVFFGIPGTGKSTLARAAAKSAKLPLIQATVADFFAQGAGFLDSVIKQTNTWFDSLQAAAPCVGFLDELDALPNRATLSNRGADWWQPVITNFLVRIDQARASKSGIILLAATNHIERVDRALLRPGRFDRQFEILPPDEQGLIAILRLHLGSDLKNEDLTPVARLGQGATGAIAAGWIRAARQRARFAGRSLILEDLLAEVAPADLRPLEQVRGVAIHEAGHAIVAHRLGIPVLGATIMATQSASGSTRLRIAELTPTRAALEAQVMAALAGRCSDIILGQGASAGAVCDLRDATRIITAVHAQYGLGATISYMAPQDDVSYILAADPKLRAAVERDLQRLMVQTKGLVEANRASILALAEELLAKRSISGDEVALIASANPEAERLCDNL